MIGQIVLNPSSDNLLGEDWSVTGKRKVVRAPIGLGGGSAQPWITGNGKMPSDISKRGIRPVISPDGQKIAYTAGRREFDYWLWDIYVCNYDGSNPINLTKSVGINRWPSWFPDSNRLAFMSNRSKGWQIYTINSDGSALTQVSNNDKSCGMPNVGNVRLSTD